MALINQINGTLLTALNERAGGSGSSGGSNIAGVGAGASFDADAVGLSAGLERGADYFIASYKRLNSSLSAFAVAQDKLDKISQIVSEARDLAAGATDYQVSDNDRIDLNTKFKALIREYKKAFDIEEGQEDDYLYTTDLKEILADSGIDFGKSTDLNFMFSSIGGDDKKLGKEIVLLSDQSLVSTDSLAVDTRANALKAVEALDALQKEVQKDQVGVAGVLDELSGAYDFALYGATAFTRAVDGQLSGSNAEQIAASIVSDIRRNTGDTAIAAHSDIDSYLAKYLLG